MDDVEVKSGVVGELRGKIEKLHIVKRQLEIKLSNCVDMLEYLGELLKEIEELKDVR